METQEVIKRLDKRLVYAIIIMLSFSLILGASTSVRLENNFLSIFKYLGIILFSIIIMFLVANINLSVYWKYSKMLLYFCLGLMLATYAIGLSVNDAKRWLQIPVIGLTIQPSEFLRIALIIFISKTIAQYDLNSKDFSSLVKNIILWTLLIIVLVGYSNISMAFIVAAVSFIMLFSTTIPLKSFAKNFVVLIFAIITIALLSLLLKTGRSETLISRISDFGKNSVYSQRTQALVAIANSNIIPHPGSSKQKYILANAESDYVFAIAIEEYGIIGLVSIIILYIIILGRIGRIIRAQTLAFPTYIAIGLAANIIIQTIIHMAVNVGIFPVTGQPLPLLSRGGSNMLATLIQLGIILQISTNLYTEEQNNSENENVQNENNIGFDQNYNPNNNNFQFAQNINSNYNTGDDFDFFSKYTENPNDITNQNTFGDSSYFDNKNSNNSSSSGNLNTSNSYEPIVENSFETPNPDYNNVLNNNSSIDTNFYNSNNTISSNTSPNTQNYEPFIENSSTNHNTIDNNILNNNISNDFHSTNLIDNKSDINLNNNSISNNQNAANNYEPIVENYSNSNSFNNSTILENYTQNEKINFDVLVDNKPTSDNSYLTPSFYDINSTNLQSNETNLTNDKT